MDFFESYLAYKIFWGKSSGCGCSTIIVGLVLFGILMLVLITIIAAIYDAIFPTDPIGLIKFLDAITGTQFPSHNYDQ